MEGRAVERLEAVRALSPEIKGCWRDIVVRDVINEVRKTVGVGRMRLFE